MPNIEAIRTLRARGWTNQEIAEPLGVNRSVVSQLLSDRMKTDKYDSALSELARTGSISAPPPPPSPEVLQRGAAPTPLGTGWRWEGPGQWDPRRMLQRAAREGRQVSLVVHARLVINVRSTGRQERRPGHAALFEKGGYDASKVLDAVRATGETDIREALIALASASDGIEAVEGFIKVDIRAL
jgi:transcriptional regulator with XRE-family HTH domain